MTELKILINGTAAVIGWIIGAYIGGLNGLLIAMLGCMTVDYVTGVLAAVRAHTVSSNVGFWGLIRKGCMLLVVGLGNLLDVHVLDGSGMARNACCLFYISNEGISILENMINLGVKVPNKLKKILAELQEEEDDEEPMD